MGEGESRAQAFPPSSSRSHCRVRMGGHFGAQGWHWPSSPILSFWERPVCSDRKNPRKRQAGAWMLEAKQQGVSTGGEGGSCPRVLL